MGNVSVKQNLRKNKTICNKQNGYKNKLNRKTRKGGQGSPLNPNNVKELNTTQSKPKTRRNKVDKSLYSHLQRFKGRHAYLKEKRRLEIAAQKDSFMSGSTKANSSKRKSI